MLSPKIPAPREKKLSLKVMQPQQPQLNNIFTKLNITTSVAGSRKEKSILRYRSKLTERGKVEHASSYAQKLDAESLDLGRVNKLSIWDMNSKTERSQQGGLSTSRHSLSNTRSQTNIPSCRPSMTRLKSRSTRDLKH